MSAFYGVPEWQETAAWLRANPVTPIEPVDDPRYLLNTCVPDRNFVPRRVSTRFLSSASGETSFPFRGAACADEGAS